MDADWLLIYRVLRHRDVLHRTGTHRDLFCQAPIRFAMKQDLALEGPQPRSRRAARPISRQARIAAPLRCWDTTPP